MKSLLVAALLTLTATVAAADDFTITIVSNPPGAMFYGVRPATGEEFSTGLTPTTATVQLAKVHKGCRDLGVMRVQWMSGATAMLPAVRVCKKDKASRTISFTRPFDAPGLEADVTFAMNRQRDAADQDYAASMQRLAAWQAFRAVPLPPTVFTPMQPLHLPVTPQATPVRCTSQLLGEVVYTDCR